MRILFLGDIVGRAGRDAVVKHLPDLRKKMNLDFVIANGENAAAGFGLTVKIAEELFAVGVDCITTGNHVWDQKELVTTIDQEPRILRPLNFPDNTPGKGYHVFTLTDGRKILVLNPIARLFMNFNNDNPFAAVDKILKQYPLGAAVHAVIVDFHAEATSEKIALGYFCDGRASLVVGTHTHVPTADARILPNGTAYQTDAGMCGPYDSIIGMEKNNSLERFLKVTPSERMTPAEGEVTLCGVFVETDDKTGLAIQIEPFRMGGILIQT